jgi:hypothetical protein
LIPENECFVLLFDCSLEISPKGVTKKLTFTSRVQNSVDTYDIEAIYFAFKIDLSRLELLWLLLSVLLFEESTEMPPKEDFILGIDVKLIREGPQKDPSGDIGSLIEACICIFLFFSGK